MTRSTGAWRARRRSGVLDERPSSSDTTSPSSSSPASARSRCSALGPDRVERRAPGPASGRVAQHGHAAARGPAGPCQRTPAASAAGRRTPAGRCACQAHCCDERAVAAPRVAGRADQRAELHHRDRPPGGDRRLVGHQQTRRARARPRSGAAPAAPAPTLPGPAPGARSCRAPRAGRRTRTTRPRPPCSSRRRAGRAGRRTTTAPRRRAG